MKTKGIVENILVVLSVLFGIYIIAAALYRGTGGGMLIAEAGICGFLILSALCLRFRVFARFLPVWLAWILRCAVILLIALIAAICAAVCTGLTAKASGPADNAVVLGFRLLNGEADTDLELRMVRAYEYASAHTDTPIVLTGGGKDPDMPSEASVMKRMLLENGIDEGRIITEDESEDTRENFENTARIVGQDSRIVIITSDYHIFRAGMCARKAGFSDIQCEAADSPLWLLPSNILGEAIAVGDGIAKGYLSL